jgi:adenylate cyclase
LRVQAVFKGRVTRQAGSLDITAELIDVRDNSHIWGEHYSRKTSDIVALQGEIAKEMTRALRVRLSREDEKRLTKGYTANPDAYHDYLKGRFWLNKLTEEAIGKGVGYFERAILRDPHYALAYSGLSDCHTSLARDGFVSAKEGYLAAKEEALKALEIDDTLAEAHVSLAYVKIEFDWDWRAGARESLRAIELNPSYAPAHDAYAEALWLPGRVDEGIAESKRALDLDPLSLAYNDTLGIEFFLARRYTQAIEQEQRTLELDPSSIDAYYFRGISHLKRSMPSEGMAELQKAASLSPNSVVAVTGLGYGYAVTGKRADAQRMLDRLDELSEQNYISPVWRAKIYAGLQDKDKAFQWLEKATEDRSVVSVGYIKANPMFDPLRSDPRYKDLLRRTNLEP